MYVQKDRTGREVAIMNLAGNILGSNRTRSIIYLVIASILWSIGGLMIKLVNWNPVAIAGMRSLIASLVILAFLKKPTLSWNRLKVGGAVAYAGTVILFVTANKLTTASNVILLQYTAPVYVALLGAWLLKEKTTLLDWITIAAVLGGMALFFIGDISPGNMLGNILSICSGFCLACVTILLRMQKDANPLESVFWGNLLTGVIGLPFMFIAGMPDGRSWMGLLLLGVFQLGFSYALYAYAVKHVEALEAILVSVIEPLLNPFWVFLFVGELPGTWAFIGGFIVLSSVIGRSIILTYKTNLAAR